MSNANEILLKVKTLDKGEPKEEKSGFVTDEDLNDSFRGLSTKYSFLKQVKILRKMLNEVLDKSSQEGLIADPLMDVLEDAEDVLDYIMFKTRADNKPKEYGWPTGHKVPSLFVANPITGERLYYRDEDGLSDYVYENYHQNHPHYPYRGWVLADVDDAPYQIEYEWSPNSPGGS